MSPPRPGSTEKEEGASRQFHLPFKLFLTIWFAPAETPDTVEQWQAIFTRCYQILNPFVMQQCIATMVFFHVPLFLLHHQLLWILSFKHLLNPVTSVKLPLSLAEIMAMAFLLVTLFLTPAQPQAILYIASWFIFSKLKSFNVTACLWLFSSVSLILEERQNS